MKPGARTILIGALIGAVIGAVILFFLGDGFAMAFYLAGEGVILGAPVGAIVGLLLFVASRLSRKTT